MVLEVIGGIVGVAMVGLLYRIAKNLGSLGTKLEIFCNTVIDHETRLRDLEN